HHHAIAQVQGHDPRMMPLMGFLNRIAPPRIHGVKHHQEADQEDPVVCLSEVDAEQRKRIAVHGAHPGDAAKGHQKCADAAHEGPRAWIDDVIVVILDMGASHYPPILFLADLACTSAVSLVSGWKV